MDSFVCVICSSPSLESMQGYSRLPRVTSDCKPWAMGGQLYVCGACGAIQKAANTTWLDEIRRIYEAYQIYNLSSGAEQVIFSAAGVPKPRSRTIVDFVVSRLPPRNTGHLIDLGCGNGSALANFSRALPGWKFDASELSTQSLARLQQIPGFETLHTGMIDRVYDVVSMIHSLEHMVSPRDALVNAATLTRDGGTIFVEVPDVETSPFDVLVADHLMHFTRTSLGDLAGRVGLDVEVLTNTMLPKELTLLARHCGGASAKSEVKNALEHADLSSDPAAGRAIASRTLSWLESVIDAAATLCTQNSGIGLLGTSISAMWLFGALGDKVEFFVDEDASRIGQTFEGRPIIAPSAAPSKSCVFVPLPSETAERVARRLAGGPAVYVTPPRMALPVLA